MGRRDIENDTEYTTIQCDGISVYRWPAGEQGYVRVACVSESDARDMALLDAVADSKGYAFILGVGYRNRDAQVGLVYYDLNSQERET